MKKQPLEYRSVTRGDELKPQVRFQTIVSCALLALGGLCALLALVWPHRRSELFAAGISLAASGLVVLLPFRRM
jgi:hypothetical protein